MSTLKVPIGQMKNRFSEYVARSAYGDEHVVITRRGKPVAALVSLDDLSMIESLETSKGLSEIVDRWDNARELADATEDAYNHRIKEKEGRDVPF